MNAKHASLQALGGGALPARVRSRRSTVVSYAPRRAAKVSAAASKDLGLSGRSAHLVDGKARPCA